MSLQQASDPHRFDELAGVRAENLGQVRDAVHPGATGCNTFSPGGGSSSDEYVKVGSLDQVRKGSVAAELIADLSGPQIYAIELIVQGKRDIHVAKAVGVHRTTLWRWREHHPEFRAELDRRRRAVWGSAADRFRALLHQAVDAFGQQVRKGDPDQQYRAARAILTIAGSARFATPMTDLK